MPTKISVEKLEQISLQLKESVDKCIHNIENFIQELKRLNISEKPRECCRAHFRDDCGMLSLDLPDPPNLPYVYCDDYEID